jgi:predicted NBD/HSP70 family sugar kinase
MQRTGAEQMANIGGANLPSVASFNESVVLDTIRLAGTISRVELAQNTGLTAQTVSTITRRLLADGLIEEGAPEPSTGGKPRTPLRMNASAGAAVGVHVDPYLINVVVTDLGGNTLYTAQATPPAKSGARPFVGKIVHQIKAAIGDSAVPADRLLGIGVAVPGPLDPGTGAIRHPPNMPNLGDVPLREEIQAGLGNDKFQVVVENDATAAAIGEHWFGADSTDDFAYIYLGTGVGAGLFLGGTIYRGVTGNGGEIGHCSVDESGPACHCGNRGCLELYCSPLAIVKAARRSGRSPIGEAYAKVCADAAAGRKAARSAISVAARHLATAAQTLVNVLDIRRIVLGGPALLDEIADTYLASIRSAIDAQGYTHQVRTVTVERSRLGVDAAAFGAVSSVFHGVMAPRLPLLAEPSPTRPRSRMLTSLGR